MSNKRLDLTKDALRKQILGHEEKYHKPNVEDVETILHCVEGIGLIAELKRCYDLIDRLRPIAQDWVKLDAHTDDGKCLILDMEDSDGNCFSGYINRASE